MQEFIKQAAQQLGADESKIKTATGGLLQLIDDHVDQSDFQALAAKIPGAGALKQEVEQGASGGSKGLLGGMLGAASSALGGKAGTALGLVDIAKDSGLGMDKIDDFAAMFTGHLKEKAGNDLVGRILGQVPGLKKFMG